MKPQFHLDKVSFNQDSISITQEGFLKVDAQVTRTGVFEYTNPINGEKRFELRHPDDVFLADSLKSLRLKPITNDHPPEMLTPENAKRYSVGSSGENVRPDGRFVTVPIMITDSAMIKAVQDGKRELSCGYFALTTDQSGIYIDANGSEIPYTHRQEMIEYNHIAIVDKGRAGPEVRIRFDGKEEEIQIQTGEGKPKPAGIESRKDGVKMRTITIDGISYEAPPEVVVHIEKLSQEIKDSKAKNDSFSNLVKVEIDKDKFLADPKVKTQLIALDSKIEAQAEAIKKLESMDHTDTIRNGVKVHKYVDSVCSKEIVEKKDSLSILDLQKEVILALVPGDKRADKKVQLDSYPPETVKTVFDTVVEMIPERNPDAVKNQLQFMQKSGNHNDQGNDPDDARKEQEKRDSERHLRKKGDSK